MNILYIHQYFRTPKQPGGTRSYWMAQELIKNGHQVTMLTSDKRAKVNRREETIDGIRVIYLKGEYNQKMSVKARLKAFLDFSIKSIRESGNIKDIDLVIATSTPLTVGITALYHKKFKKSPYIFEVRDLWPEVPIQMGAINNPLIIKLTRWFEKSIYVNAEHVVALSPGMQEGVIKYIPKEKTSMIPNMSKIDKFWPREKNWEFGEKFGLSPNTFKLVHFGTLGLANGIETIIDSAELLKSDKTIEFLFVGGGASEEDKLKQLCKKKGMQNVRFFNRMPMKEISEFVNLCDVSLVSFKNLPILYTNSPNKLFDSLSAGKPIIVNSAGWTKSMVEENNCGFYVNPENPGELKEKILFLQKNGKEVDKMGWNARMLAEKSYDKTILSKQFVGVVNKIKPSK